MNDTPLNGEERDGFQSCHDDHNIRCERRKGKKSLRIMVGEKEWAGGDGKKVR